MLQVSPTAATAIAHECRVRALPESAGARLFSKSPDGSPQALALEFTAEPEPGDRVLQRGPAFVFVAENISSSVRTRLLDVDGDGSRPRLVLRRQRKH
ncbi:MAG: hypothetical protein WEB19_04630 [Acidimicrobiia bacterium]